MSKLEEIKKILDSLFSNVDLPLYEYRKSNNYFPVLGEGSYDADIVFIGEAPGKNEAETGKPFCGRSGKVLDKLLLHINLKREDVYITSIVNDRPPQNRDPFPKEIEVYAPYLKKQIEIIKPKVIATLGRHSMSYILREFNLESELQPIGKIHGKVFKTKTSFGVLKIVALYHPAVAVYDQRKLSELKKDFETLKNII